MRDQGMSTVMISGDGITDTEFAAIGGPGVEGTLMTFGPEPRLNPNAKDAVAAFRAKGFDPQGYTLYSYAAVQIIKQAAEKANSLDPKKVAAVMHSGMPFHTVIGDIAYDKKGDRTTVDYVWYVWKKGADGKIASSRLKDAAALAAAGSRARCLRSRRIRDAYDLTERAGCFRPSPDLFRHRRPLRRVIGGDHRIVSRQVPFLAILVRRHAQPGQVTPHRLESFAVFETDHKLRRD